MSEDKAPNKQDKTAGKQKAEPKTAKILDDISRKTDSGAKKRAAKKTSGASKFFSLIVVLLPFLAGLVYLAWQQFQMQQSLVDVRQQNQALQSTISSQDSRIQQLLQQLQQLQQQAAPEIPDNSAALAELSQSLNAEVSRLQQQLAQLQSNQVTQSAEVDFSWKVFEAEYLLSQAAQKLQLESDIAAAIALMEQADAALLASEHSAAFGVRQALGEDLASLRGIELLDREGLYLRLQGMIATVDDLDLLSSMREDFVARRNQESVQIPLGNQEQGWWNASLDFLGEIFVWRRWDERPEAMLAPGQETLIKLNLRLMLKEAQLALLLKNQSQFQQSLASTRSWLQRYAVTDSAAGRSLDTALVEIQQLQIDPALPDLSASLTRARQLANSERQ